MTAKTENPPSLPPLSFSPPITPPTPPRQTPSPQTTKVSSSFSSDTSTLHDMPPPSNVGPLADDELPPTCAQGPAHPSPPSPVVHQRTDRDGHTLPAPIGIPARKRANTANASFRPSLLSSSPTHTPFSMMPTIGAGASLPTEPPPSAVLGNATPGRGTPRRGTPIGGANGVRPQVKRAASTSGNLPGSAPRTAAQKATHDARPSRSANGTPSLTAKSKPAVAKTTDTTAADLSDISFLLAHNSCAADSLAGGNFKDYTASVQSAARRQPPKRRESKSKWHKLFDFDNMLGALDPSRMAANTAPEPISSVVFGAETESGLAVCRSMLAAKNYILVALMVDTTTPATEELEKAGVRVVQIDMDNPASYTKELRGAQAVYLSSNVLALHAILHHQPEPKRTAIARRADQCQMMKAVNACARAKVGHLVFRVNACGHEIVENVLGKQEIHEEAPEDLKRLGVPHTVLHTSVPFSRLNEWLLDSPDGLILDLPVPDDTRIPWFAIEQTGEYVLAAFRNPKKWMNKEIHAISEVWWPSQLAERLSKVSRRPVVTTHMTREEFDSLENHERLACKWDAWAQLVRGNYDFDHLATASREDVAHEWKLSDWMAQDGPIHQRLKF